MKKFPVAEIFGPTVQGEGVDQGTPCHFVRFGGCDYKCDWCDTPHAVLPQLVRHNPKLTSEEILDEVADLTGDPTWIIISGGNPALHDLSEVVKGLQDSGFKVAMETQGTLWKNWIGDLDRLCISPKPPSSEMLTDFKVLDSFLDKVETHQLEEDTFIKVVVFDHNDYQFAATVHDRYPKYRFFLSAGNDAGKTVGNPQRIDERTKTQIRNDLLDKTLWLTNRVMVDKRFTDAKVQCQFHVALWGNELGR